MISTYTDWVISRLGKLVDGVFEACETKLNYHDHLRAFKEFCDNTPLLSSLINELPQVEYDFEVPWQSVPDKWPGEKASYGMKWSAIAQMVEGGPGKVDQAWPQLGGETESIGLRKVTLTFVKPVYDYLVDNLEQSSAIIYTLLRYKRWAEWFEVDHLREVYGDDENGGERALDESLRQFLFESGIDYPFSQPASPGGRADVVAGLETDDPLVLEIKVWDSSKGYSENRIRDGLRQAMDYAIKYGKEIGYIVVFNLDLHPLAFSGQQNEGEWPPRLDVGGRSYYFIDVHIAEKTKPISQQDKGKLVKSKNIDLPGLLTD